MINNKRLGLLSSAIFAVGVFLPVIDTPFGSIGFFSNFKAFVFWEGFLLLIVAIVSACLFHKEKFNKARILSSLALILVGLDVFINHLRILTVKAELMKQMQDNPFSGLAETMMSNLGLSWAWIFLLVGSVGMVLASFDLPNRMMGKSKKESKPMAKPVAKTETKVAVSAGKKPAPKKKVPVKTAPKAKAVKKPAKKK